MRTPQHDTWLYETFGVRVHGAAPDGAKPGEALGKTWQSLTTAVGKGAQEDLGAVRAMGRANGKAFDRAVDGVSSGVTRLAGAQDGAACRRDAQRLARPVRFVANFTLGAGRGLGEAGGEFVKGTGDAAVAALRVSADAQYRAKVGRDAKLLWRAAQPMAMDAVRHPARTAHMAGHAVKAAVNKTLDEGEAAQRTGNFAEWDGHFAFKLAANVATSIMPQTKAAKVREATQVMQDGLKAAGASKMVRLRNSSAEITHAMANAPAGRRAAVSAQAERGFLPRAAETLAVARQKAGARAAGVKPLSQQVAFLFAIEKDNKPGSWFEARFKNLSHEQILAKLEAIDEKELEAQAPYCHAFLRASALSRITGEPMAIDAHEAFRHLRKPVTGIQRLASAKADAAAFPTEGMGHVMGQGRRIRFKAARSITQQAGTATARDRKLVMDVIAKHVPSTMIEALKAKGVDVVAVRDSIVQRLPHLRGQQMADYTTQTGEQTKGIYHEGGGKKQVIVASVLADGGAAGARRIPAAVAPALWTSCCMSLPTRWTSTCTAAPRTCRSPRHARSGQRLRPTGRRSRPNTSRWGAGRSSPNT